MNAQEEFLHKGLPVYFFATEADFEKWLSSNYNRNEGFWMRYYKKATKKPCISVSEAVDVALCYGWIDGLLNSYDEDSYLVRFTQRRPKSVWSKVNVAKVEKLIASGRMQPNGLVHVDAAKQDGRWAAAYSSKKTDQ